MISNLVLKVDEKPAILNNIFLFFVALTVDNEGGGMIVIPEFFYFLCILFGYKSNFLKVSLVYIEKNSFFL